MLRNDPTTNKEIAQRLVPPNWRVDEMKRHPKNPASAQRASKLELQRVRRARLNARECLLCGEPVMCGQGSTHYSCKQAAQY